MSTIIPKFIRELVPVSSAVDADELEIQPADSPDQTKKITFADLLTSINGISWHGAWASGEKVKNVMATQDGWLGITNKATSDDLAPKNIGAVQNSLDPTVAFTENAAYGTIKTVTSIVTKVDGSFLQFYIKVPFFNLDTETRLTMTNLGTGEVIIQTGFILDAGVWNLIKSTELTYKAGQTIEFTFEYYRSDPQEKIEGKWDTVITADVTTVGNQEVAYDDSQFPTVMAISHNDLTGTDRTAELRGVPVGSILLINEEGSPDRYIEAKISSINVDNAAYTVYAITTTSQSRDVRDGKTADISVDVLLNEVNEYFESQDYYLTGQPSFATISTELYIDNSLQPNDGNYAYGLYVAFQELSVSADWDLMAHSAAGGSITPTIGDTSGYGFSADKALVANSTATLSMDKLLYGTNIFDNGVEEYTFTESGRYSMTVHIRATSTDSGTATALGLELDVHNADLTLKEKAAANRTIEPLANETIGLVHIVNVKEGDYCYLLALAKNAPCTLNSADDQSVLYIERLGDILT